MSPGSYVGDAAAGRDLVFVSYSHEDAQWVQRCQKLLEPLVRRKRLRLWPDTDIPVGDEWHPAIFRAIERSSVALLLVSADFLSSEFIMDQELPTLIKRGVRLAPALVGDCFWDYVPELKRVQWLHDPGRDGALNLVADQPGQRDRRLREICERLVELAPDRRSGPDLAAPVVVDTAPVVAVHAGPRRAKLFGVPALPPGYLARDELPTVIDAVVSVDSGAVGLTGAVPAVGLHGQGGIGKSVMAAAVARDEGIGRMFPDGVYWVTAGEKADVLAVQLELLARLGVRDRVLRTPAEALSSLREALADRSVLLVVDDVWSDAATQAFRATGPRGRVLYTSRDPQVLTAVGARRHQVDILSPAAARALAAAILDIPPAPLPAAADRAFGEVGHVALAVALLAAAVHRGRLWEEVAGDLQRDAGIFGDHPYANTFKAMQLAVTGLPDELANALLSLAVFPSDTQIPVVAITRYWAHTRGRTAEQTAGDLAALAAVKVLRVDEDAVGFHDLQHDYLLLHAPTLALLHAALLEAYRRLLPDGDRDQWWRLPVGEPYVWDHLVGHLCGAGERRVLAATVTDPAYLAQRIAAGGPHAAEADLARASAALSTHDLIVWWQGWVARHAHLLTPVDRIVGGDDEVLAVAPTMLAWLTVNGSLPTGVDPYRLAPLLPNPYLRIRWGLTPPATALLRALTGHTRRVRALAWSTDGTRLSSADDDGMVRVWDPVSGQQLSALTLTNYPGGVWALAWSTDGTRLSSADDDGMVRVWDPVSGQQLSALTLTNYPGGVWALAWSTDGTRLVSIDEEQSVWVWNPVSGQPLSARALTGLTDGLYAVAWSADGTRLARASIDDERGVVRVWDPVSSQLLSALVGHTGEAWALAWSADGTRLASADDDGVVRVWDPVSGQLLSTLAGHVGRVKALAWSADGTRLASGGHDGVRVWDPVRGQQLSPRPFTGRVKAVAWSADSALLASADEADEEVVRVWDPVRGQQLWARTLTGIDWVRAMAWPADGIRVASVAFFGHIIVRDPVSGQQLSTLSAHTSEVWALRWSADGTRLASAGDDGMVRVWDPVSGQQLSTLTGHTSEVWALRWSADGTRLASAGDDGMVRVWDPVSGQQLSTLTGHTSEVRALRWSADGTRLASAGDDGMVRVWDPVSGQQLSTLTGHTSGVRALAWSPDGTRLASTTANGTIHIFDPDCRGLLTFLHIEPLTCLQWVSAGIAAGGPHGVCVLDLACP